MAEPGLGASMAMDRVVEENVAVYVRCRPRLETDEAEARDVRLDRASTASRRNLVHSPGEVVVAVSHAERRVTIPTRDGKDVLEHDFDGAFGNGHTNADVYAAIKGGLEDSVRRGLNVTVFAYGQTGSGKTHTMLGGDLDQLASDTRDPNAAPPRAWGVVPRAVADVFNVLSGTPDVSGYSVSCTYMQIYSEKLYDLIADGSMRRTLAVRESPSGGVFVPGLSSYRVAGASDVLRLIRRGNRHRSTRATEMNEMSSRSHAILQLSVEMEEETAGPGGRTVLRRVSRRRRAVAGAAPPPTHTPLTPPLPFPVTPRPSSTSSTLPGRRSGR